MAADREKSSIEDLEKNAILNTKGNARYSLRKKIQYKDTCVTYSHGEPLETKWLSSRMWEEIKLHQDMIGSWTNNHHRFTWYQLRATTWSATKVERHQWSQFPLGSLFFRAAHTVVFNYRLMRSQADVYDREQRGLPAQVKNTTARPLAKLWKNYKLHNCGAFCQKKRMASTLLYG
jgi:hypothetical protein